MLNKIKFQKRILETLFEIVWFSVRIDRFL